MTMPWALYSLSQSKYVDFATPPKKLGKFGAVLPVTSGAYVPAPHTTSTILTCCITAPP
jgi:hypothetical protein